MAKKTVTLSFDEDIKNEFQTLCESVGLNMSTALQMFMLMCVRSGNFDYHIPAKSHFAFAKMDAETEK